MNKDRLKDAFISILIGAVVAFTTVFLEGFLEFLQDTENNIVAGGASSFWYAIRHIT